MIREKWMPTLVRSLKTYNMQKFVKDLGAGFIVAIIALPLSIALAIASGVRPENGLYSAIIGGVFVSLFSGSKVQIGGITAATVMTVCTIINRHGMAGLATASIMAGIFLLIMGACRLGSLLKYIPITITTGFTAGIAIGIFTSQIKEFFGLTIETMPIYVIEKWIACFRNFKSFSWYALTIGFISVVILIIIPRISERIPAALVMIIIMTSIVKLLKIPVNTVGSVYGDLPSQLPSLVLPPFSLNMIIDLFAPSLTLALLIAIVSLLSCVVTDGMIGERHNSNTELIAQGIANIFCGFFQAVPVAGAVARSSYSIKSGGRSQVVGIVHSVIVLGMLLLLMPLVSFIPMPSLSAMLMVVAYNMINWKEIRYAIIHAPKSDAIVLISTISIAFLVDLMAAIEVGILITALLFMKRMAEVTTVQGWKYIEEDEVEENLSLKVIPKNIQIYEIYGPMFFAASDKILSIKPKEENDFLIIRMRGVVSIDATAMHRLEQIYENCKKVHVSLLLAHVNEQPLSIMKKAKFDEKIGEDNFCAHLDDALLRAEVLSRQSNNK